MENNNHPGDCLALLVYLSHHLVSLQTLVVLMVANHTAPVLSILRACRRSYIETGAIEPTNLFTLQHCLPFSSFPPGDKLRDFSQPRERGRRVRNVPLRGWRHETEGEGPHDGGRLRRRTLDGRCQDVSQEVCTGAKSAAHTKRGLALCWLPVTIAFLKHLLCLAQFGLRWMTGWLRGHALECSAVKLLCTPMSMHSCPVHPSEERNCVGLSSVQ